MHKAARETSPRGSVLDERPDDADCRARARSWRTPARPEQGVAKVVEGRVGDEGAECRLPYREPSTVV